MSELLSSYIVMYIVQSFSHSITGIVIAYLSILSWKINNPRTKQGFYLSVIVLSVLSFPLYQIINPERGSVDFRLNALLNLNNWLNLELLKGIPLGIFLLLIFAVSATVFIFQELLPILRHSITNKEPGVEIEKIEDRSLLEALDDLSEGRYGIFLIKDDDNILYSVTGREAAIYLSEGLVKTLTDDQLRAAVAHEIAHIERNKRPVILTVFLMRIIMFFNPVVLLLFRKVVQEEEKICDDIAVSLTQNAPALAGVLKRLYHNPGPLDVKGISNMQRTLEDYSHNLLISNRIERLEKDRPQTAEGKSILPFILTVIVIMVVNYFIA